uniref:Putative secreted protein n=1 Tax=Anopheles triannulatus TaxID=58253 RepID=A0A2M4B1F2_9DIPT
MIVSLAGCSLYFSFCMVLCHPFNHHRHRLHFRSLSGMLATVVYWMEGTKKVKRTTRSDTERTAHSADIRCWNITHRQEHNTHARTDLISLPGSFGVRVPASNC